MGRNGAGKTTLLKSLVRNAPGFIEDKDQQFPIDGGEVRWGHEVAVGDFAEERGEAITKGRTGVDLVWEFYSTSSAKELRGVMWEMVFRGGGGVEATRAPFRGAGARR